MRNRVFKDQCDYTIKLAYPPKRIISLVPSQTELLSDLGLDREIVGITKYCVHPTHWLSEKTVVGGTKNFDLPLIQSLNPDLIIGNKEENYKEGIEILKSRYPVWMSDIYTLSDAFAMMGAVGEMTSRLLQAEGLVKRIASEFAALPRLRAQKVLYLIWRKPWMAAASKTFIDDMLSKIGLENVLASKARYPELSDAEISRLKPDLILLSSEPFPFREKHIAELINLSPDSKVVLVDGEMFSWYGSRLLHTPTYFKTLTDVFQIP
jgi:ABC-type Fe3+-hydroxamate transport system substrate-binding protein